MANLLIALGFTRDSKAWLWTRVLAVAALVASGAIDVVDTGAWLGIEVSDVVAHRVTAVAVVVLWLSGKYDSSPLPGKKRNEDMKINWRKVLEIGTNVGQMFLPKAVSDAIDQIEDNVEVMVAGGKQGWSGPEKQAAALDTLLQSVAVAEGITGDDLLHDPTVLAAGRKAIDATHAAKVAVAEFKATIETFKAAKNPQP